LARNRFYIEINLLIKEKAFNYSDIYITKQTLFQIYCCVGVLSLTHSLHHINPDLLGWWLCERQLPSGGLNGRPEKLPDVCYSWWVLASLKVIGRIDWIDKV